ncbi:Hypothetical protein NCS54_00644900 [Fusarium falciforme]|uniref:Hypothetical protein n=1 Tax=Fusarium falciforme TaxID=195108 RepID=UPI002301AC2B|nr:Hypothetical protein NCS54_00644900 [Fusarium falciforme]WAO89073.1 Hypothetical protein NCS54_00644900 [Fusarium falciforme]
MSKTSASKSNTQTAACGCWYCTTRTQDSRRRATKKTSISVRRVDPVKLESLLNRIFKDKYAVSMRDNSYTIWAERQLEERETLECC